MSFRFSPELERHARAVMKAWPDLFGHLEDSNLGFLMTDEEIRVQGREKAGYAAMPQAQGQSRKLLDWALESVFGFSPDALVVVQEDLWATLTENERIALTFHELRHLRHKTTPKGAPSFTPDGRPVLEIDGHDTEEFLDVVQNFGAWHKGLENFKKALGAKPSEKIEAVKRLLGNP